MDVASHHTKRNHRLHLSEDFKTHNKYVISSRRIQAVDKRVDTMQNKTVNGRCNTAINWFIQFTFTHGNIISTMFPRMKMILLYGRQ